MRPRSAAFHSRVGQGFSVCVRWWVQIYPPGGVDRPPPARAPRGSLKISRGQKVIVKKVLRYGGRAVALILSGTSSAQKKPLDLSGLRLDLCDGLLDHLDYASRAGIIFLTMAQRQLAEQSNY